MKRLTDAGIRNLAAEATRREIPDPAFPGLYLVVQPTGAKSWAVRYRIEGRTRKMTLGKYPTISLANARIAADDAITKAKAGEDPAIEAAKAKEAKAAKARAESEAEDRDRLARVFEIYWRRKLSKLKSGADVRRLFDVEIVPILGDQLLRNISRRDVNEMLDAIVDRGSPITANRVFAHLRAFLNWARGRGVIDVSPCDGMQAPSPERQRDRVLSADEISLFWRATGELGRPFGPLYRLLLLTGARLREAAHMTDAEIDGETWTIPPDRSKNGQAHTVHLSALARETLDTVRRIAGRSGYVFTTNGASPVSGFAKGKARLDREIGRIMPDGAACPPFTIHDLRRTAASGMAELRIAPHVVEAVLNHRSGTISGVARVYNRYSYADEKRAALEAWSNRVGDIVGPTCAQNVVPLVAKAHGT